MSGASQGNYVGKVSLTNGYTYITGKYGRSVGSGITEEVLTMSKVATVANITQLTFTTSTASAFDIGTKIRIYRGDMG